MPEPLCDCVWDKIREQIQLLQHLIDVLPPDGLNWVPDIAGAWPVCKVLGHLIDCLAGVCAVLVAAHPDKLPRLAKQKENPIGDECGPSEAQDLIALFSAHIDEGFATLRDQDLARRLPTVFTQSGEAVLTLLLGNLEHLINHKHQLFVYLKLMGVNVGTPELYCFRQDGSV
jgi:hypothetical protein